MLLQTPWELDDGRQRHLRRDPLPGRSGARHDLGRVDHPLPGARPAVCLSATVTNADEIAAWISRTHRPIRLITHTERAVPLSLYYFIDAKLHQVVDHTGKIVRDFPHTGGEARRQNGRGAGQPPTLRVRRPGYGRTATARDHRRARRERAAPGHLFPLQPQRLPAVRRAARGDAPAPRHDRSQLEQIEVVDRELSERPPAGRPRAGSGPKLITDLARKGIGFHHAGLLPVLKQLVEVLFGRGLMEVVFATDTLALGRQHAGPHGRDRPDEQMGRPPPPRR